jgi:preprotein translocase subunit SecB
MRPSPIQLIHTVYRRIAVSEVADSDIQSALGFDFQGVRIKAKLGGGPKKGQEQDPKDFLITLALTIENSEGKRTPYNVDVSVMGVFKVLPSLPKERREDLVTVNGASILYGAVREMVINLTSRFPAGALILPGMNFQDHAPSLLADAKNTGTDEETVWLPRASRRKPILKARRQK